MRVVQVPFECNDESHKQGRDVVDRENVWIA